MGLAGGVTASVYGGGRGTDEVFGSSFLAREGGFAKITSVPCPAPRTVTPTCRPTPHLHNDTVKVYTSINEWTAAYRQLFAGAASVQAITTGNAQMAEGSIKRLTDKGFGFITVGGDKDLFFHSSSLQGVTFEELREGQKVSYTEGRGPKGPRAENVTPV
jgi:cold shock protein